MGKNKKNIFLTLFLICSSLMSLISCSKSNDELILGTWKCDNASSVYEYNGVITIQGINPEEIVEGLVWTFTSGGYVYNVYGDRAMYTIDDNYLIITENNNSLSMKITELSKEYLSLSFHQDEYTSIHLGFKKE